MAYGNRRLMPHSQGLSNNPYPEPNQPNSSLIPISLRSIVISSSHQCLRLRKGLIPVGLPVNILKALFSSILATWPVQQIFKIQRSIISVNLTMNIASLSSLNVNGK